jgi:hypothetical protein
MATPWHTPMTKSIVIGILGSIFYQEESFHLCYLILLVFSHLGSKMTVFVGP